MDKKKGTTKKIDSDFEHLKMWQDNPNLKYYLSEKHWNCHVNKLLYAYLTSRYNGDEVGVYINIELGNGENAFKIDYNQIYGVMFNEAYSFCSYVLTNPVPEADITFLESKAETLCPIKLAKPIVAYNTLVMTGLLLCFANDKNDAVSKFLNRLSNYNHSHYFGDKFHHFENYIKIGLNCVAGIMIDGQIQSPGKLRSGYDYKEKDEYLRKTIVLYKFIAEKMEKNLVENKNKPPISIKEQNNFNSHVFNGPVTIIKDRPTNIHQELRSKFWFDYNNRNHSIEQEDSTSPIKSKSGKLGRKKTSFKDFVVNTDECDKVITLIKKHIIKDSPKQVALVIAGGIEAGKIRQDVTAPSIEREFCVNGNSVKPHLSDYRTTKGKPKPYFSEAELKPYKDLFIEQN